MKRTPINDNTSPIPWLTFQFSECGGWRSALPPAKITWEERRMGEGSKETRRLDIWSGDSPAGAEDQANSHCHTCKEHLTKAKRASNWPSAPCLLARLEVLGESSNKIRKRDTRGSGKNWQPRPHIIQGKAEAGASKSRSSFTFARHIN
jgi:hypothetical protein